MLPNQPGGHKARVYVLACAKHFYMHYLTDFSQLRFRERTTRTSSQKVQNQESNPHLSVSKTQVSKLQQGRWPGKRNRWAGRQNIPDRPRGGRSTVPQGLINSWVLHEHREADGSLWWKWLAVGQGWPGKALGSMDSFMHHCGC